MMVYGAKGGGKWEIIFSHLNLVLVRCHWYQPLPVWADGIDYIHILQSYNPRLRVNIILQISKRFTRFGIIDKWGFYSNKTHIGMWVRNGEKTEGMVAIAKSISLEKKLYDIL